MLITVVPPAVLLAVVPFDPELFVLLVVLLFVFLDLRTSSAADPVSSIPPEVVTPSGDTL